VPNTLDFCKLAASPTIENTRLKYSLINNDDSDQNFGRKNKKNSMFRFDEIALNIVTKYSAFMSWRTVLI
jgi:hypothetical protein